MDKIKLNLDNPIFAFYVNIAPLSRQKAEQTLAEMRDGFDIYENITIWFLASDENRVVCIYSGKGSDPDVEKLVETINERVDILSKSRNFDDFKINIRDWRINNLLKKDEMKNEYIYFIAYPGGDRTKLSVCYESTYTEYEIKDYAVASRHRWDNPEEANEYCKKLAKENNLIYVSDEDGYLD